MNHLSPTESLPLPSAMERPLHADDLVAKKSNTAEIAVVERTYSDVDTHEPHPARHEVDNLVRDKHVKGPAFHKFLKDGVPPKGTVLVRWHQRPVAEIIPESKLELLDRSLLIGDVVKRDARDAMSGVVINSSTKCTIQPMCDFTVKNSSGRLKGLVNEVGAERNGVGIRRSEAGIPPPLVDIPASELKYSESFTEEELIIYKDYLGRVADVDNALTLRLADNGVVEIDQDAAEHPGGEVGSWVVGDIACTKKGYLRHGRWIYGEYNANTPPVGTVVSCRPKTAEVIWLQRRIGSPESVREPPDVLERDELESADLHVYDRTRALGRSSTSPSLETVSTSEIDVQLGLRVRFKDIAGASVKYDGSTAHGKLERIDRRDTLGYEINVFDVMSFRTDVTVQWQDLTITHESSTDLIPDSSIDDEHAAWPGEIAHTLDRTPVPDLRGVKTPNKTGVVQSVDAAGRMARLKWCPDASLHYFEDFEGNLGLRTLVRGVVGRAEGEQEEISLYDIEAPGEMNVRRGDIVLVISDNLGSKNATSDDRKEVDWLGEIVDTCLDGSLTVRLGAATEVRDVSLKRENVVVAVRSDGTDQDGGWEDGLDDGMSVLDASEAEEDESEESSGSESEENEVEAKYEDENGVPLDEDDVEGEDWESDDSDEDVDMKDAAPATPPTSHSITPPDAIQRVEDATMTNNATKSASDPPEPYMVLESIPDSHHFASQPLAESAVHMKRTQKEHKILRSANVLPHGVYVRTWESRLDLIRVLFIGPDETPYADAPFVIDFYLPVSFPNDPPQAFFHSWPGERGLGGSGRVNPNLYEDGKICLSLLGTWEGNKGEGWNAGRSTLLQVIVSLLGLVLVREPYFNEAGYEPLAGLESSKRPSALYNERTFLRAKTFVITAMLGLGAADKSSMEMSIDGVDDVLRWLYKDKNGKKLLEKNISDVEAVLKRSENSEEESDGRNVMSKGVCIPLRRVLDRLREL